MLQMQARALGDPTRYEIFRKIADSGDPIDVSALTAELGLNHNAIRQHLSKLVDADLIVEFPSRSGGRGRPRLLYSVNPAADSRWGLVGPYEKLSLLLTEILRTGDSPSEVGRRAGRAQPLTHSSDQSEGPLGVLMAELARQGFDPELEIEGGEVRAHLLQCPFASAAVADPDTVCGIHTGMVEGILGRIEGFQMDSFERAAPASGKCCVRGHLVGTEADACGSASVKDD